MIQLTYEPAFDTFNSIFRIFRLWSIIDHASKMETDRIKILDFFLLFPFRISSIRLKPTDQKFKKLASTYEESRPYGQQPEAVDLMRRMTPIQEASLRTLAYENFLDNESLELGLVRVTGKKIPGLIEEQVRTLNEGQYDLIEFLSILSTQYDLLGPNGLKSRTKLLEYRYDAV